MNQTVDKGKTLLVDGPASVTVGSGRVEVFGSPVRHTHKIVIREGKRLPFFVAEKTDFDVALGENASVEVVDGDTIPPSWTESLSVLKGLQKKPAVAMIVGKADSGKTSYCTYLINKLLSPKHKIAIIDGDLGQSDIGPPCTVAYAFISKHLTELYSLKAENAFFVGATSPSQAPDKTVEGMALMKTEILGKTPDFILVNTDGWVEGEDAVKYKLRLAEKLEPDTVLCIQRQNELEPLLAVLEKFVKTVVESPSAVKQRGMEKRKNLRELNYAKYMIDAKVRALPLSHLRIEEENVALNKLDEVKGALLGLYDSQRKFLGIGVLHEFDNVRKTLKILTSVSEKPAVVAFGKVRLDKNLRETASSGESEPVRV
ncbi:MAG: Clp1/GlmU family protein [Candidatus Bathyarchaeota archaeon]|nr:Clp1/GlmU family protein [Candidatus Bathyarchaeota archaeon]